jgi:hypothetical protein
MFRFTIRDVLWLILVAAVAFSWFRSDRKHQAELEAAIDRQNKLLEAWKTETADTIERYREAALDPVAYQDELARRNKHVQEANRLRSLQLRLRPEW